MRHKNSATACRRHAEACKRLARRSRDEALTSMLLMMARSWVALANQIDRYTILRKQLKRTARWAAGQHQSLAAHRSGPSLAQAGTADGGSRVRDLARISHSNKRIGAPNQRKFFCEKDFPMIRGAPRCRQS